MTVSLVKLRSASGTVWESTEKREVKAGDYHWCGTTNEPELLNNETILHVCRIWQRSEDQDWQPAELPACESQSPIDQLIQRVTLTSDSEGGNIGVLAKLYQAKALEGIRELLEQFVMQHLGGSTSLQTEAGRPALPLPCCGPWKPGKHFPDCWTAQQNVAGWCVPCRHGTHEACHGESACYCTACHRGMGTARSGGPAQKPVSKRVEPQDVK